MLVQPSKTLVCYNADEIFYSNAAVLKSFRFFDDACELSRQEKKVLVNFVKVEDASCAIEDLHGTVITDEQFNTFFLHLDYYYENCEEFSQISRKIQTFLQYFFLKKKQKI